MFERKHLIYLFAKLECHNSLLSSEPDTLADMQRRSELRIYLVNDMVVHCAVARPSTTRENGRLLKTCCRFEKLAPTGEATYNLRPRTKLSRDAFLTILHLHEL